MLESLLWWGPPFLLNGRPLDSAFLRLELILFLCCPKLQFYLISLYSALLYFIDVPFFFFLNWGKTFYQQKIMICFAVISRYCDDLELTLHCPWRQPAPRTCPHLALQLFEDVHRTHSETWLTQLPSATSSTMRFGILSFSSFSSRHTAVLH